MECDYDAVDPEPTDPESTDEDDPLCADLGLAHRAPLCILITGRREAAWATARKIARSCGSGLSWIDCDTAEPEEMADLLKDHVLSRPAGSPGRILFLREVQALTPEHQSLLNELIESDRPTHTRPRLIASSSLSLYECVRAGLFDEALFYKLNAVHIAL